jgi:signal transduction histidine kinase
VLRRTGVEAGVAGRSLDLLERSITSLHALLEALTTQARLDAGQETREIGSFDAASAMRELCAVTEVSARERGLSFQCDGPEQLLVDGDEIKVRRIVQNLLINALTYTPEGGITVTWGMVEDPPKRWVLCVQDTGPGLGAPAAAPLAAAIEAATRDALAVEADARSKGDTSAVQRAAPMSPSLSPEPARLHGEGVGLSIVKRLCELLDASVELQTAPGKGTTVRVTFPCQYRKG